MEDPKSSLYLESVPESRFAVRELRIGHDPLIEPGPLEVFWFKIKKKRPAGFLAGRFFSELKPT
ncbi:hypothetical protein [Persicitalea jodogahamensis]|uniref:Uncharacterized protein n=1 Tax=Persicitalea jodogahamensis TaxID=402147 RepID=A0A8J3D3S2_9BACT|nr:hypothetical protein [Persicitalea jodogahamensis]GHB68331.1 hypothetical protein GCM10007390_22100 [Persicitalea jodogahamensis]